MDNATAKAEAEKIVAGNPHLDGLDAAGRGWLINDIANGLQAAFYDGRAAGGDAVAANWSKSITGQ